MATADLVDMLQTIGGTTGLALEPLIAIARWLEAQLEYLLAGA